MVNLRRMLRCHPGPAMARNQNLLLANRNFRNLWLAQTGSNIGDWFHQVALAQTTLAITHSAEAMGLVLLCRSFTGFVPGPLVSPLVDHFGKKKAMIVTDFCGRCLFRFFILAIVLRNSACLFVGAFLLGLSGVMFNPAAQACLMFANPGIATTGVIIESVSLLCGMYWLAGLRPNVANRNGVFM